MAGILTIVDGDEIHEKALEAARNTIKKCKQDDGVLLFNHYRAALVTPDASETGAAWNIVYGPADAKDDKSQPAANKEIALEIAERYVATGSIEAKD